jgi:uncharacterized protein (TIGR00299 family) protein
MNILYYDCFAGISGDMNLAALIDLGVDKDFLISELKKLKIQGYTINVSAGNKKGISGIRVEVVLMNETSVINIPNITIPVTQKHKNNHEHRNLADIEAIINNSELNKNIKELSKKIFIKIAEAEAKVHGKALNEIHFHEVGAVDSIVDIVGAAICIDYLKPDKIISSPIQLGSGIVKCEHGSFPVPAPATAEILKNIPVKTGLIPFESTTPTGAAIVATLASEFQLVTDFTIEKVGYGIGHKDSEIPNVLRVYWANTTKSFFPTEQAYIVECNIDDMNPEIYEYLINKALSLGADDVFLSNIIMKKTRPAITLSVLCKPNLINTFIGFLLQETTTLGVRQYAVTKHVLNREIIEIETIYGKVKVKKSFSGAETIKFKPEYDDCLRIAKDKQISLIQVMNEINKTLSNLKIQ